MQPLRGGKRKTCGTVRRCGEHAVGADQFPGIEMKILYSDPTTGMSTILFKMAPGAQVPLHKHTAVEQTYMLSGSLMDDEGVAMEGNFVWRPGGNTHVASAPEGAVFLAVFMKPNRFAAGTRFFTEAGNT